MLSMCDFHIRRWNRFILQPQSHMISCLLSYFCPWFPQTLLSLRYVTVVNVEQQRKNFLTLFSHFPSILTHLYFSLVHVCSILHLLSCSLWFKGLALGLKLVAASHSLQNEFLFMCQFLCLHLFIQEV